MTSTENTVGIAAAMHQKTQSKEGNSPMTKHELEEAVERVAQMADWFSSMSDAPATDGPVVGQWAVIGGSWQDEVAEITKVSAKQVRTRRHGDREARHLPQDIVFSGTEKQARDLLSVLKGLSARNERNRQQLAEQHRASRAAAIAKATTASSVGIGNADEPNQSDRTSGEETYGK